MLKNASCILATDWPLNFNFSKVLKGKMMFLSENNHCISRGADMKYLPIPADPENHSGRTPTKINQ